MHLVLPACHENYLQLLQPKFCILGQFLQDVQQLLQQILQDKLNIRSVAIILWDVHHINLKSEVNTENE